MKPPFCLRRALWVSMLLKLCVYENYAHTTALNWRVCLEEADPTYTRSPIEEVNEVANLIEDEPNDTMYEYITDPPPLKTIPSHFYKSSGI